MNTIDRYVGRHFSGPFIVGVAAFVGILLGIGEIYNAVQLIVREGIPASLVIQSLVLRMPSVVALTMPMATVFAALMASGELSSHGEIVAMRAGGVSVWRLALPVVIAAAGVSVLTFTFNEAVGPACNRRATKLIEDYVLLHKNVERPLNMQLPDEGPAQLLVYADKFNLAKQTMANVTIMELKGDRPADTYFARTARWEGHQWLLIDVVHTFHRVGDDGRSHEMRVSTETTSYDIGKTPEQMGKGRRKVSEDMTLSQLRAEIKAAGPSVAPTKGKNWPLIFRQHYYLRIATPWAALCFALLGFPLGMRPQRTSAGVGFGLSLAIVFVYYIIFNVLKAFGEQGAISPLLAAWLPNVLVLGVGLGLMMEASR